MAVSSANLAASAAVKAGPGQLCGVVLTAGSDTATVIIYNNTAGSGTILTRLSAVANTSAVATFPQPLVFSLGIYATIAGTAPNVTVAYI